MTQSTYSSSYREARQRFCDAAHRARWSLKQCEMPGEGPAGEPLSIDIAVSPEAEGPSRLVLSSGLHGVEGYFGSAVQLELLKRYQHDRPPAPIVMWHGLNPWGFAWDRRSDENNVDLNRNFLLEGQVYEGCSDGYRTLDSLLNPSHPPRRWDGFLLRALRAIAKHGVPALRQAVAGGQYAFPRGSFFGGCEAAALQRVIEEQNRELLSGVRHVMHLDFHTGLGRWAKGKLLIDTPLDVAQEEWFRQTFGRDSFEAPCSEKEAQEGMAYQASGSLGCWCVSRAFVEDYRYACAEFGTFPPLRVLSALRRENQAYHWADAASAARRDASRELKHVFCPTSQRWRRAALAGALRYVERALKGLVAA
ncbi:MAG: M14 family metallopeptidase [Planctomycetota bacterium]